MGLATSSYNLETDITHYLMLDGILQIPKISSFGMVGTEPDYFPMQQPLL